MRPLHLYKCLFYYWYQPLKFDCWLSSPTWLLALGTKNWKVKSFLGCHRLADFVNSIKQDTKLGSKLFKDNCDQYKYGHSCFKYAGNRFYGKGMWTFRCGLFSLKVLLKKVLKYYWAPLIPGWLKRLWLKYTRMFGWVKQEQSLVRFLIHQRTCSMSCAHTESAFFAEMGIDLKFKQIEMVNQNTVYCIDYWIFSLVNRVKVQSKVLVMHLYTPEWQWHNGLYIDYAFQVWRKTQWKGWLTLRKRARMGFPEGAPMLVFYSLITMRAYPRTYLRVLPCSQRHVNKTGVKPVLCLALLTLWATTVWPKTPRKLCNY